MSIYVPRAPRANDALNVLDRMHSIQTLSVGTYNAKRSLRKNQRLQNKDACRQMQLAQSKLMHPGAVLQQNIQSKQIRIKQRKFPKLFVGLDVALLAFVLAALCLPGSIPANFVSFILGGK